MNAKVLPGIAAVIRMKLQNAVRKQITTLVRFKEKVVD